MNYELFYLIGASKEEELEKIKKDVEKTVTENEGVFEELRIEEKKRLAYKIKHETYGYYIVQRFEIEPEKISEINKKLNLHPGVLRFMISKSSDLPELKIRDKESNRERKFRPAGPERFKERKEAAPEQKKSLPSKGEEDKKNLSQEEKKSNEDIDKKLEEILNI
jgi:ribosomal protein S6